MTDNAGKKPLGIFRQEILHAEIRLAARKRNRAAFGGAYVATAREVMSQYPELTLDQRKLQLGCLKHEIELAKLRTGRDDSHVLPVLSKILDAGPR